ncbi:MAG: nucleotidyl transferase AbiEii/AbiGii toxin family protein [Prevotella sp.]|nr:nucleotidyl transferase AbiEii/AbiGii toxin family protein [Prevotella sp.]
MIPVRYITEWGVQAPWVENKFIEQDLIICRALCSIYSDAFLAEHLAFRGGTALGKLFLTPQPRYSEDIDLVQVNAEPIKETIDHLRDALIWLGQPVVKQKKHNNTLVYKVAATDTEASEIHLKVEINCKEHFNVLPMVHVPFSVNSSWFSGQCEVLTYELAELTGTKLRAVYQRRKGRDLFDLWKILTLVPELDKDKIMQSYERYLGFTASHLPTYKEFVMNMEEKLQDDEFLSDTDMILGPEVEYDAQTAWEVVKVNLVDRLIKE